MNDHRDIMLILKRDARYFAVVNQHSNDIVHLANFWFFFNKENLSFKVYHMCDDLGRQFSYNCPNTTLFQQRMLICDHWYMVNCSKAEKDYDANLLIGKLVQIDRINGNVFHLDLNYFYRPTRQTVCS